jgi:hypothetical protein
MHYNAPFNPNTQPTPRVDIIKGDPPKNPGPGVFHTRKVMVDGECRGYWRRPEASRGRITLRNIYNHHVQAYLHDDGASAKTQKEQGTQLVGVSVHVADENLMLAKTYDALAQGALPSRAEQIAKAEEQQAAAERERVERRRATRMVKYAPAMHDLLVRAQQMVLLANTNWHAMTKALLNNINLDSDKDNES